MIWFDQLKFKISPFKKIGWYVWDVHLDICILTHYLASYTLFLPRKLSVQQLRMPSPDTCMWSTNRTMYPIVGVLSPVVQLRILPKNLSWGDPRSDLYVVVSAGLGLVCYLHQPTHTVITVAWLVSSPAVYPMHTDGCLAQPNPACHRPCLYAYQWEFQASCGKTTITPTRPATSPSSCHIPVCTAD